MRHNDGATDKGRILRSVYGTSMYISMTAMTIIVLLELFMLFYTFMNPTFYGPYIQRYRGFYIALLTIAVAYFALCLFVKGNLEERYRLLNAANPVCTFVFLAWAVGITWSDMSIVGTFDPMVFMTFSLIVPLSFYMLPAVYAGIVAVVDACLMALVLRFTNATGVVINLAIFFIFQLVLGVTFLQLKGHLARRIVMEEENAYRDVMTGLGNRRAFEADLERIEAEPGWDDLTYIAIDINGLKAVNDGRGHAAGDRLIVGAAQCIRRAFAQRGRMYRIGGDEFAVVIHAGREAMADILNGYEAHMRTWSAANGMKLTTSYGYVCAEDMPDSGIRERIKVADRRMYEAKERYYQANVNDRRKPGEGRDASRQPGTC